MPLKYDNPAPFSILSQIVLCYVDKNGKKMPSCASVGDNPLHKGFLNYPMASLAVIISTKVT